MNFEKINIKQHWFSIVSVSIWIVTLIIVSIFLANVRKNYTVNKFHIFEEMTELKYNDVKYQLAVSIDDYIKKIAPTSCLNGITILDNCLRYDIDICFVLAQGEKESHFGTQGLARKTNSVFNVFAYDGHGYDEICNKGKYKSPDASVEPYMQLLQNRYLIDKTEYDLLAEYVDKNGQRYASAPDYEDSLRIIYNRIKTNTPIDSLTQELKKYSIILGK